MKKIKILLLLTGGLFRDGITLSQLDYMKHIDKKVFQIDVACVLEPDYEIIERFEKSDCIVRILPNRKHKLIQYMHELKKLMKKEKYDIIHVHRKQFINVYRIIISKVQSYTCSNCT